MDTNSTNWKQKPLLPKLLKEEDASYKAVIDLQMGQLMLYYIYHHQ